MSLGSELYELLDEHHNRYPIVHTIIETGCLRSDESGAEEGDGWSTLHIARWIECHCDSCFISYEQDFQHIRVAKKVLLARNLLLFANFCRGDSVACLEAADYSIDFAYLDSSDNLPHALAEFEAVEARGARIIVMDDRQTKCLLAMEYAREGGRWKIEERARLTVFRRGEF
jgi:hypothetical protein